MLLYYDRHLNGHYQILQTKYNCPNYNFALVWYPYVQQLFKRLHHESIPRSNFWFSNIVHGIDSPNFYFEA